MTRVLLDPSGTPNAIREIQRNRTPEPSFPVFEGSESVTYGGDKWQKGAIDGKQ